MSRTDRKDGEVLLHTFILRRRKAGEMVAWRWFRGMTERLHQDVMKKLLWVSFFFSLSSCDLKNRAPAASAMSAVVVVLRRILRPFFFKRFAKIFYLFYMRFFCSLLVPLVLRIISVLWDLREILQDNAHKCNRSGHAIKRRVRMCWYIKNILGTWRWYIREWFAEAKTIAVYLLLG